MDREIPKFIAEKEKVVVDVLADPEAEDSDWNRRKNGLWEVTGRKFAKRGGDEEDRLYVTLKSVGRKNLAFITLPFDARVIRPLPTVAEAFRAEIHAPRRVIGRPPARFRPPGQTP